MDKIDVFYRAFKDYRKVTKEFKDCQGDISTLRNTNPENDILEATKYKCTIDEEWVKHIEDGLTFVEKALAEERQFIRQDGEIVPIEKVKKISRASVEHLAKHSNFITHIPEDAKNIVPDKIYMVEKLSDYAVYENRFLYMLLSYLHEFIMYRLEKIEKIFGTYDGHTEIHKNVEFNNKKISYDLVIKEHRENNPYPIHDDESKLIIQRIKDCDQIINAMLNTDLMIQVAKSPMIKPPITKTNVLKMNNNFKNALALYDYIAGYTGLGYESSEVKNSFHPLKDNNGMEIAEGLNLLSFTSYKIGNEIEDVLNTAYEAEEERRKQEEAAKLVEKINRIKKKAKENGQTLEEYLLLLEERNKQLEHDSQELILYKNKVVDLNKTIDDLNMQKAELNHTIDKLNDEIIEKVKEINALNQKYIDDMAQAKREHEEAMKNLTDEYEQKIVDIGVAHQEEIDNINQNHQNEIDDLNNQHQGEIDEINQAHEEEVQEMNENFNNEKKSIIDSYTKQLDKANKSLQETIQSKDDMKKKYEEKITDLNDALKDQVDERKSIVKNYETKLTALENSTKETIEGEQRRNRILKREKDMMRAEMNAMRLENGKLSVGDEFATRERFDELEDEYMAFNNFFKEQWKYTKKEIRKTVLWERKEKRKKVGAPIENIEHYDDDKIETTNSINYEFKPKEEVPSKAVVEAPEPKEVELPKEETNKYDAPQEEISIEKENSSLADNSITEEKSIEPAEVEKKTLEIDEVKSNDEK